MAENNILGRWLAGLASARLFWALLVLNLVATIVVVAATFHTISGDHYTYLGYADGLLHGRYSYWYFLPDYIPDTFRNPGYPIFLFFLKGLGFSEAGIRLTQTAMYIITIAFILRIASHCEASTRSWLVRNLLLLILLPNVQLSYLAATISPEILLAFLLAAYGVVVLTWPLGTWRRTLALAGLAGLIFQTRPVFILFPIIQLGLDFWHTFPKSAFAWGRAIVLLGLFGATMLPYALWNYQHHGILKTTPLEGGGGVMQLGFWAFRMPNYHEIRYWGNTMGDELVSFVDSAEVPGYIAGFNQEWDAIDAQCRPLLTARDRHYLPLMRSHTSLFPTYSPHYISLFPTYSSAYTIRREKLLMQANLAHIRSEPGYYLKTRLYTLVRLWVTGIQRSAWKAASTPLAKLKLLYPTVVSGITFLLALIALGWVSLRQRLLVAAPTWRLAVALVVYFGVMHLPFIMQARYTVPVRPWLFLSMAMAIATWLNAASNKTQKIDKKMEV